MYTGLLESCGEHEERVCLLDLWDILFFNHKQQTTEDNKYIHRPNPHTKAIEDTTSNTIILQEWGEKLIGENNIYLISLSI